MTTQAHHSYDTALTDQRKATEDAQALANDYKRQLDSTRDQLHSALAVIKVLELEVAALEHRLGEAHQGLTVADEQGA